MRQPLAIACALFSLPLRTHAQRALPALPEFEGHALTLSPAQADAAARGEPAVLLLEPRDARVVAVLGVVATSVPRRVLVERLISLERAARIRGLKASGVFRTPATAATMGTFTISAADVAALRACKPGSCEFKLPASDMARARAILDSGADGAARLAAYARRRVAEYVNEYRERGTSALITYDDFGAGGVRASDAAAALLSATLWLTQHAPALQHYLQQFPHGKPAGASEVIYWTLEALPGLRTTLTIDHRIAFSPPGRANLTAVATRQIFANHYYEGALEQLVVLDRGEGSWLVVLRQYRFDHLPGGLLKIREKARAAARQRMEAELNAEGKETRAGKAPDTGDR